MFDLKPLEFESDDLWLVLLGVFMLAFFYSLKKLINSNKYKYLKNDLKGYFGIVQTLFWVVYFIYFFIFFLSPSPLIGVLILVVISLASWNVLRDLFTGLILNLEGHYKEGSKIILPDGTHGTITKMRLLNADIELKDGQVLIYRYNKLSSDSIIKPTPSDKIKSFTIELTSNLSPNILKSELKQYILNLPWSTPDKEPIIDINEIKGGLSYCTIRVYTANEDYFNDVQKAVVQDFNVGD